MLKNQNNNKSILGGKNLLSNCDCPLFDPRECIIQASLEGAYMARACESLQRWPYPYYILIVGSSYSLLPVYP